MQEFSLQSLHIPPCEDAQWFHMGSNVIFESVSDMTFSIAAIFQLVLSIDYSIMLLHRYQQEYKLLGKQNKPKAMRNAILNAFSSVSSSSITTIIGLLVLLMMSFIIGRDIGLVVSKGVFFSLVCVFTVVVALRCTVCLRSTRALRWI